MKTRITALLIGTAFSAAYANHPDSVYVRPDIPDGTRNFQIAYSQDKQHWTHLHCNLFQSDYSNEKKLYYPVLSYDGKTYKCVFIPNPDKPQIAVTQSADFTLWKPQDYPYLSKEEFARYKEQLRKSSAENIIRIPWAGLQAMLDKQKLGVADAVAEREDYILTAAPILENVRNITGRITINPKDRKPISSQLIGVFFEDISHAADGGLYAELLQNRDFEYNERDRKEWNAKTAWSLDGEGTVWSIETEAPLHPNNAHYTRLQTSKPGARLTNSGWDGIPVKENGKYLLSLFLRGRGKAKVSIVDERGTIASTTVRATNGWKQQKTTLTAPRTANNAHIEIEPLQPGVLDIDFVSLFPKDTYKGRTNGMRKDLAEVIAGMKPRFVRFPGGCATHGQGIDNIYHWQATIGELWERQPDLNIWGYHQTRGIGFYEYFTFCEDIGAEPLPVLAAGVPCQNSGIYGDGQQGGIPFEAELNGKPSPYTYNGKPLTMESYLQELLDLIEWANGDAKSSKLAAMRAKAGHPQPFNLKYLGIGNEDLVSDVFLKRYIYLTEGVKKAHPEITVVGTVGPNWKGSDYEYGWEAAKKHNIEMVDEHYYNSPGWYFNHRDFYDNYGRNGTKVYLGEWASRGNHVSNALVEAAYLANMERNADVVSMSSYAPLLAREGKTNWNPDLIYFNNTEVKPTANYFVQRIFGHNLGDEYIASTLQVDYASDNRRKPLLADIAKRIDQSVVVDGKTGDLIVKLVSLLPLDADVTIDIDPSLLTHNTTGKATLSRLVAPERPERERQWSQDTSETVNVSESMRITLPAYSVNVIRIGK